jgi:hypothetical protein
MCAKTTTLSSRAKNVVQRRLGGSVDFISTSPIKQGERIYLLNRDIAASEIAAIRITICQLDRKDVERAITVIRRINGKTNRGSPRHSRRPGEVGLISIESQTRKLTRVKRNAGCRISIIKAANNSGSSPRFLEFHSELEIYLTAV